MATPAGFLSSLVARINERPERLGLKQAAFQFVLSGEGGGTWTLSIVDGKATVEEGPAARPGVSIEMSAADFQEMAAGRLGPVAAYMSGRLRIQGDLGLAMRLQPLLG